MFNISVNMFTGIRQNLTDLMLSFWVNTLTVFLHNFLEAYRRCFIAIPKHDSGKECCPEMRKLTKHQKIETFRKDEVQTRWFKLEEKGNVFLALAHQREFLTFVGANSERDVRVIHDCVAFFCFG